ncbi:MAG: hypothetical protein BWX80_04028 [Candidatus Hydrogenedentes bacterium ADurb.Bin101]|nr:MAG: hypothetical protein BWX80_04028 [Candidatus Hydrogenedentes bacterium ADurb.Bin101]
MDAHQGNGAHPPGLQRGFPFLQLAKRDIFKIPGEFGQGRGPGLGKVIRHLDYLAQISRVLQTQVPAQQHRFVSGPGKDLPQKVSRFTFAPFIQFHEKTTRTVQHFVLFKRRGTGA